LGPPDLIADDGKGSKVLAYLYDRFGNKDWCAHVIIAPGRPITFGYNATSANDYSQWKPYPR
jgi:hypothetical protein